MFLRLGSYGLQGRPIILLGLIDGLKSIGALGVRRRITGDTPGNIPGDGRSNLAKEVCRALLKNAAHQRVIASSIQPISRNVVELVVLINSDFIGCGRDSCNAKVGVLSKPQQTPGNHDAFHVRTDIAQQLGLAIIQFRFTLIGPAKFAVQPRDLAGRKI